MCIGLLIKNKRRIAKMTQKELADGLCSVDYIYKIENGKRTPSIYLLHELSKKLNCDLYSLYFKQEI